MPGTYRSPAETGLYYLGSRYYDPEVGRFISPDTTDVLTVEPDSLTNKNLYAYCDNNPLIRVDVEGDFWELAVAGGGMMSLGSGATFGAAIAGASALAPVAIAALATVVVVVAVSTAVNYSKSKSKAKSKTKSKTTGEQKERVNKPIARRNYHSTRKKAEEAARRAGGGKKPDHHPKGTKGSDRNHYHPQVKNNYRLTPHGYSYHDHFYY